MLNLSAATIVLMLTGVLNCFGSPENDLAVPVVDVDTEIHSLFNSMSRKSTPLFICDPEMGGIEWLLPSSMSCETQPKDTDVVKPVGITVYWTDITHQEVEGFECTGIRTETNAFRNTWPWSREGWSILNQTTTVEPVTAEQCNNMVHQKIAPNGKKLNRVTDMVFETGYLVNRTQHTYFFARGYTDVKTNFRIQQLVLGISELDNSIQTTAPTISACFSNSSSCPTSTGILVWKGDNVKVCRLIEGEKSNCAMRTSEDFTILSCPDLKLSLHNVTSVKMCDLVFGYSMGIFFLYNEKNISSEQMATPEIVRSIITRPRNRRDLDTLSVHPFEAETKANMNYLYETIRNGTVEAIYNFEQKVCETNKIQLDMLNAISQSGHPSITTRMIYKDDLSYRADFSGDVLTVYKCIEVTEYMFTDRQKCSFEWPVSYVYNHKVFNGFMTPTTHTIISTPTVRSTRNQFYCPKFYFKTPDYIVLLSNSEARKVNLPTLPQLNAVHERIELLPPLSFAPTGNLESKSDDVGTVFYLLREIQVTKQIKTRVAEEEIHYENRTEFSFFKNFFGGLVGFFSDLWTGIVGFIWSIILPVMYAGLAVIIFVVLMVTGILPYLLKLPAKLYFTFKRRISLKNIKKALGSRRRARHISSQPSETFAPSAPLLYVGNGSQASTTNARYVNVSPNYQNEHSSNYPAIQFHSYPQGIQNWQAYQNSIC